MKECTTYPKFSAGVKSSILLTYWTIFLLLLKKPFPYPRLPCSIWIFFMTSHVHFQITIGYKWISADWTLKWFQFLVHGHNMVMQSFLVKETFFAFITLKWFELQMNIPDVTSQTRSTNTHHSTLKEKQLLKNVKTFIIRKISVKIMMENFQKLVLYF